MTPFYFGAGARRLFGIYEPAASGGVARRAAVLCHPWGSEYLFAHRTLRQLAVRLCGAGFHTLRFDFFGTGDSAGEMTDADLAGWQGDVGVAMDELADIAGTTRVTLLGLRLGGTIAATVAARRPGDVEALVLWDPVVSGPEYVRHLEGFDAASGPRPEQRRPATADAERASGTRGFPLSTTLLGDIRSIALDSLLATPAVRTLMLVTERLPSHAALPATTAERGKGSLAVEFMTAIAPWTEESSTLGLVPVAVIQRILTWLE
jgi:pimeloyl-ACP methyl ester carboxylesterase